MAKLVVSPFSYLVRLSSDVVSEMNLFKIDIMLSKVSSSGMILHTCLRRIMGYTRK